MLNAQHATKINSQEDSTKHGLISLFSYDIINLDSGIITLKSRTGLIYDLNLLTVNVVFWPPGLFLLVTLLQNKQIVNNSIEDKEAFVLRIMAFASSYIGSNLIPGHLELLKGMILFIELMNKGLNINLKATAHVDGLFIKTSEKNKDAYLIINPVKDRSDIYPAESGSSALNFLGQTIDLRGAPSNKVIVNYMSSMVQEELNKII